MAPYLLLILAVCAADQLTKLWAMNFIFDHATAASGIAGHIAHPEEVVNK